MLFDVNTLNFFIFVYLNGYVICVCLRYFYFFELF